MSLLLLFRPLEGEGPPAPVFVQHVYRSAFSLDKPENEAMPDPLDVFEDIFGDTEKRSYLNDPDEPIN